MTAEQNHASDPSHSAWVSASAGSGKTKVLTDRVMRLLLEGVPPERILCITYTNAAAGEMRQRVAAELASWVRMPEEALASRIEALTGGAPDAARQAQARRLFFTVLDHPEGLRIQTIHAFCQSLLARFPVEAGISPGFRLMDETSARALRDEARRRVLAEAVRGEDASLSAALDVVSGRIGEAKLADLLKELIDARDKLAPLLEQPNVIRRARERFYERLGLAPFAKEEDALALACHPGEADAARLSVLATALEAKGGKTCSAFAGTLARWAAAEPRERMAGFSEYQRIFFADEGHPRKLVADCFLGSPLEAVYEAELARLDAARRRMAAARVAQYGAALFILAEAVLAEYQNLAQSRGAHDFQDLIHYASALLNDRAATAWVLFKLDGGIDHILLDEAQDTSLDQWKLVEALTEEFFSGEGAREADRTLFVVGDEKQSIYSFQGAAPAGFQRRRDDFAFRAAGARKPFASVALTTSFRSVEAVLEATDAVFADPALQQAAMLERPLRHVSARPGQGGVVELWPLEPRPGKEEDAAAWDPPPGATGRRDAPGALARRIAARIRHWLDSGETLPSRGRAIAPGDILILVRRRHPYAALLRAALLAERIPVSGFDRLAITDHLAVQDLLALGAFALLPQDDLTLACLLKSPLCNVSEEALFALAHERGEAALWQRLRSQASALGVGEARDLLTHALGLADRVSPHAFFAEILEARGGRHAFIRRFGHEVEEVLDAFLAQALDYEQRFPASLQGFLQWLRTGGPEIKREAASTGGEVRILTVHSAKGLQAPVVFLPDTADMPDSSRRRIFWIEDAEGLGPDLALPFWLPGRESLLPETEAAREAVKAAETEEYYRLLYVAMTRAEDRLILCGAEPGKKGGDGASWYRLCERRLSDRMEEGPDGIRRLRCEQRLAPDRAARKEQARRPEAALPGFLTLPPPPEPQSPAMLAPSHLAEPSPPSPSVQAGFRRGEAIHRLLQFLPELPPERRPAAVEAFLAARAEEVGSEEERPELQERILALLSLPECEPMFGPGSRAEAPIAGVVEGVRVSGRIDRLLVTPERVAILDYKTGREPPAKPSATPSALLRQQALYARLLREIYPGRAVEAYLLWTETPALHRIDPLFAAPALTREAAEPT